MPQYELYILGLQLTWLLFVFAFGACVGSLINVLVYRLPRGIGVVTPPSRCPKCDTRLTFRENLPILGWILLRGKCRYCSQPISPEYPIVEAFVALLFTLFYILWFMVDPGARPLGLHVGAIRPEWAWPNNPLPLTIPLFVMLLFLVGSLVAMTLVDAKTFTIPLVLTWVPALAGLVVHVGTAIYAQASFGRMYVTAPGHIWALPTPVEVLGRGWHGGWGWIFASIGGVLGLGIGNLLLATGLVRRSFEDYHEWEQQALGTSPAPGTPEQPGTDTGYAARPGAALPEPQPVGDPPPPEGGGMVPPTGDAAEPPGPKPEPAGDPPLPAPAGTVRAPSDSATPPDPQPGGDPLSPAGTVPEAGDSTPASPQPEPARPPDVWIQYPHARREMVLELAFLAPCMALGLLGWYLGKGMFSPQSSPPLWLAVLGGVLMGYLIGGGVVWAVRVLGSFAFGKEAMGLGDAHMMAGVGACVGWIDATIAFFLAAFVAIILTLGMVISLGRARRTLPFGPSLAIATVLVLLGKPVVEWGLSRLLRYPVNLP